MTPERIAELRADTVGACGEQGPCDCTFRRIAECIAEIERLRRLVAEGHRPSPQDLECSCGYPYDDLPECDACNCDGVVRSDDGFDWVDCPLCIGPAHAAHVEALLRGQP